MSYIYTNKPLIHNLIKPLDLNQTMSNLNTERANKTFPLNYWSTTPAIGDNISAEHLLDLVKGTFDLVSYNHHPHPNLVPFEVSFQTVNITVVGERRTKTSGQNNIWDGQTYSIDGYKNVPLRTEARAVGVSSNIMFGFAKTPTSSVSYISIDHAMYLSAGSLIIYEKGVYIANIGTYADGDILAVEYDGATSVVYKKNGIVLASRSAESDVNYYFNSSFYQINSALDKVAFYRFTNVASLSTKILASHYETVRQVIDDALSGSRCAGCSTACTRSCSSSCLSECSSSCTSDCSSACGAACSVACSNLCGGGNCGAACSSNACGGACTNIHCGTTCATACGGACSACTNQCGSVSCGINSCTSTCHGTCTSSCMPACTGYQGCGNNCTGICKGCIGPCVSACKANCNAGCTGSCHGYCMGCSGYCNSLCGNVCGNTCANTCGSSCAQYCGATCGVACGNACQSATCGANCSATCGTGCTATCGAICQGATCGTNCTVNCYSACSASCSTNCNTTCAASCYTTCSSSCMNGCANSQRIGTSPSSM
jgi:hypothetical protein